MQIKQTNEVLSCEHRITQSEIISALMKYMYTLSLFTRQFQCKKNPPKNSIVSILILMTLYHSNDANNKSKEVNIIDPEEQIPSSHSAPSKVLVPAPSDTRGSSPFVSARLIALIGHDPYLFPKLCSLLIETRAKYLDVCLFLQFGKRWEPSSEVCPSNVCTILFSLSSLN